MLFDVRCMKGSYSVHYTVFYWLSECLKRRKFATLWTLKTNSNKPLSNVKINLNEKNNYPRRPPCRLFDPLSIFHFKEKNMTIKFCGAAREVTGSCHLLTLDDGFTILLDCGLYQGHSAAMTDFNEKWLFSPAEINCLVLSHAHIDHTGRVPKLVKDGFTGDIHCTHATRDLSTIMLLDSGKIQESDAQFENKKAQQKGRTADAEPLYTVENVRQTMRLMVGHNYNEWISIHPNENLGLTDYKFFDDNDEEIKID